MGDQRLHWVLAIVGGSPRLETIRQQAVQVGRERPQVHELVTKSCYYAAMSRTVDADGRERRLCSVEHGIVSTGGGAIEQFVLQ